MSEVHLQLILKLGLGILLVLLFDGLFLVGGIVLVLSLGLGLCKSQMLDFHSQYIHSFSITDGLWL